MATLYLRNVPEEVRRRLRIRATRAGTSTNRAAIALLTESLGLTRGDETKSLLEEVRSMRSAFAAKKGHWPDPVAIIRRDRNR